jgi:hypothetical protein
MKLLQIVKTEPDAATEFLMQALGKGKQITRFDLYRDQDYQRLVELIFDHDEVISWW